MKKNNRGFTMVEIIGVIIIMGVILLLVIPGVSKLMSKFRSDYYVKLEDTIRESGRDFFNDNKIYLPDGILESTYVNVSSLIKSKYAESLLDYKGNSCEIDETGKSYVVVINKGNGKYEYQTCIDCSNEGYTTNKKGTYCDPAWLSNDNLGYDYGGTDDIYFYYGTPREQIRDALIKGLNIVKYDSEEKEKALDRVAIGDTNEEGILPTNIDIIDNKPTLDSENKKEYIMKYGSTVDNNEESLNAIIYKHKAPVVTMESKGYTYSSGSWTNGSVYINLKKDGSFFAPNAPERTFAKYQVSINDGEWNDINCGDKDSCTYLLSDDYLVATYQFRLVDDEGNISDETDIYSIKIDQIDPYFYNVSASSVIVQKTTNTETGEEETAVTPATISFRYGDNESGISGAPYIVNSGSCSGTFEELYCSESSYVKIKICDIAGNCQSEEVFINYKEETSDQPDPEPEQPDPEPEQPAPEPEQQNRYYTIKYSYTNDSCISGTSCITSTSCIIGQTCTLATNNYKMANYHSSGQAGWYKNSNGTGTYYSSGADVTETNFDNVSAGSTITLYSYYEHDLTARKKDKTTISFNSSKWPWTMLNYVAGTFKIKEEYLDVQNTTSLYGCTERFKGNYYGYFSDAYNGTPNSQHSANTCFSRDAISNKVWQGYQATCKYCGDTTPITDYWCPVHGPTISGDIGGSGAEICDADEKTYSSDTCKIHLYEDGWTPVSK